MNGTEMEIEEPQTESMDPATQLEARRKRREAIRAKYRSQATPMRLQALHIGADKDAPSPKVDSAPNNAVSGM